jgi:hypothetical protein
MSLPVIVKRPGAGEPASPLYYVVAANGIFQVRRTQAYRAVTRVASIPGLLHASEVLELDFPPLPGELLEQVLAFFREVWRVHRAEAIVLLFYDAARRRFRVDAPAQAVSGWLRAGDRLRAAHGVSYASLAPPADSVVFGSIHSHGDLHAFASHTDCRDELVRGDGLHVVYGDLEAARPSRSAAFVANGVRFELEPESVLEPARAFCPAVPAGWMARVRCDAPADPGGRTP